MKGKKNAKLLIAVIACITALSTTAYADSDSVLNAIKDRIGDTSQYETFKAEEYNGMYTYSWLSNKSGMSVTADESGNIESYSKYDYDSYTDEGNSTLFRFSESEQKKEKAYELANALNPGYAGEFELESIQPYSLYETNGGRSYRMRQYYIGIPMNTSYYTMTVKGDAISSYYYGHEDTSICEAGDIMTELELRDAFMNNQGLELCYRLDEDYINKTRTVYPAYCIKHSDKGVDAITGELKSIYSYYGAGSTLKEGSADSVASTAASVLTEAEENELEQINGLYSKEQLIAIAGSHKLFGIPADAQSIYSLRKDDFSGKYVAEVDFSFENGWAYVTLDAKTGTILSANIYGGEAIENEATDDYDKLISDDLAVLAGDTIGEFREEDVYDADKSYDKTYVRMVNEIPFYENKIKISVDKETGLVDGYSIDYYDNVEFPEVTDTITIQEAQDILFENEDLNVEWIDTKLGEDGEAIEKSPLCSFESPNIIIDAVSGEIKSGLYQTYETIQPFYTDAATSVYSDEINDLADVGVGFKTELLEPDKPITQFEFLTLARNVIVTKTPVLVGGDTNYDYSKSMLLEEGIVSEDELVGNDPITKSFACTALIRMLGLEDVASLEGIYVAPYEDVTENVGSIAILNAMKIVTGEADGLFYPNRSLTRGEALAMLYDYLVS